MRPVRVLPEDLADQIAAGEVVERPASVVKELVENAIDAGARSLWVEIEGGGIALVRVSDDGHGMSPEDARLAIRRHATSKIATRADLDRITTLGFRGEALPSIASVSRFTLSTRSREALVGTQICIEGGGEPAVADVGCAPGKTVSVRDLFFNVPARRKFLKSPGAEAAHVREVLIRAALAVPGLRITLVRDGKRTLELLPVSDAATRARALFPEENLASIEGRSGELYVLALLSAPERARNGARDLHLYVNGRPVRDRALGRAVAFAYGSVLPPGRHPVGVVHVRLPPERVDVNVHPQKAEVRFDDPRTVLEAITRILARGLGTSPWRRGPATRGPDFWTERLRLGSAEGAPAWGIADVDPAHIEAPPSSPAGVAETRSYPGVHAPVGASIAAEQVLPLQGTGGFAAMRVVGQVARTFVVCEADDRLVILDQHAADERIRFDRLRTQFAARSIATQRLLLPERVEVTASEATRVEEDADTFAALGIEVTRIGETTVALHAVPALLRRAAPERLLRDVLAELAHAGERAYGDTIDRALATIACHGALRAGDLLSFDECRELVRQLDRISKFAGYCPHGRPVAMEISLAELERRVGR